MSLIIAFFSLIDIYLIKQKRQHTHVDAAGKQSLGLHHRPWYFTDRHIYF